MSMSITNEPTEAQVEAAAKVIYNQASLDEDAWDAEDEREKVHWREDARAVLVAAAGAAPQAESASLREALHRAREHFTAIAASGEIRVWEDTGEKLGIDHQARGWAKRGERICFDALAAPVLPSSGVDEDALAEVVRKSENAWQKATGPTTRHEWIARAVAQWLKGQGNAARE